MRIAYYLLVLAKRTGSWADDYLGIKSASVIVIFFLAVLLLISAMLSLVTSPLFFLSADERTFIE